MIFEVTMIEKEDLYYINYEKEAIKCDFGIDVEGEDDKT